MAGSQQRSFFQRIFVQNVGLKIVSLLLAIGLWLVVTHDPPAEVEMRIPIEFHNLPNTLEIDSANYTEAQVRVRGPEQIIRELRPTDIHADLELKDAEPGEHTFVLTAQQIHLQRDLTVVQVVPVRVTVIMEKSAPAGGH
jgi:diadenylate cyclase